jgi:hypothetical protein
VCLFEREKKKQKQTTSISMPDRERFKKLCSEVRQYTVKDIRVLLSYVREKESTTHSFFPRHGITCGEFAAAYVLSRQKTKSKVHIK